MNIYISSAGVWEKWGIVSKSGNTSLHTSERALLVGKIPGNNDQCNYLVIIHQELWKSPARARPAALSYVVWSLGGDQEPQHLLRGRWVPGARPARAERCSRSQGLPPGASHRLPGGSRCGADTSQTPALVVLWPPGRGNQACEGRGLATKPI